MIVPAVAPETWRPLYDASLVFRDLRPWETLYDSDLFGVENPITGQVGYCSVLGALGQVYALCVYRGAEGLHVLLGARRNPDQDAWDFAGMQNCLMAEFEDREELDKQDLGVLRALGLKFRGRKVYPMFRSLLPGYYPWFLTEDEAAFLALALGAACEFVAQVRRTPKIVPDRPENQCLVYSREGRDPEAAEWTASWRTLDPPPEPKAPESSIPGRVLRQVATMDLTRVRAWEAGCFLVPYMRIRDRDRPYYPRSLLVLDRRTGIVLASHIIPAFEDEGLGLRDFILSSIRSLGMMPQEILVSSPRHQAALNPLAASLGFRLRLTDKMPALQEARAALIRHAGGEMDGGPADTE